MLNLCYSVEIIEMSLVSGVEIDPSIQVNRSGSGATGYIPLDMDKALRIYKYYTLEEKWISICRTHRLNITFRGGVIESFGSAVRKRTYSKDRQNELINIFSVALDYRDMFGMCPIKIIDDPNKPGKRRVVVPQFGTGLFMQRMNPVTLNPEIVFSPYKYNDGRPSITGNTQIDPTIHVFVWPGHTPHYVTNSFNSVIFKLYDTYCLYKEALENTGDADFNSSHPPLFTQVRKDTRNQGEATEQELYVEADVDESTPEERKHYKRDVSRARQLEMLQRTAHERDSSSNRKRERVNSSTQVVAMMKRPRTWEDRYQIEDGEEIVQNTLPKPVLNLSERQEKYEEEVCITMGIPKSFITRQSSGKGVKMDSVNEQHVLRVTVDSARGACSDIYDFFYGLVDKDKDDRKVFKMYKEVDELENRAKIDGRAYEDPVKGEKVKPAPADSSRPDTDPKAIAHQKQLSIQADTDIGLSLDEITNLRAQLDSFAKVKKRGQISFPEDPFSNTVEIKDLLIITQQFALSAAEEVNIVRKRVGYEPVSESDPIVKMTEKAREYRLKQLKMASEPKPVGQTGGAAATKKPKKTESKK